MELNLGALVDGFAAFRIGASDRTGSDVVRELLLNGRSKSHRIELGLNIRERTTVRRGHGQVGARAVFGPPPASANDCGGEEQNDEGSPQGGALVRLGAAVLRSIGKRGRRVDSGDRRRRRERQRPRKLSRDQLGVERARFRGARPVSRRDLRAAVGQLRRNGSSSASDEVDRVRCVGGARCGAAGGQGGDEIVNLSRNPWLGLRRAGYVVGDVMRRDLQR